MNHLAGGRLFPGEHQRASFRVEDADDQISLEMQSADGRVRVDVAGRTSETMPPASILRTRSSRRTSAFFEPASSATRRPRQAIASMASCSRHTRGASRRWRWTRCSRPISPITQRFPAGTIAFDCAPHAQHRARVAGRRPNVHLSDGPADDHESSHRRNARAAAGRTRRTAGSGAEGDTASAERRAASAYPSHRGRRGTGDRRHARGDARRPPHPRDRWTARPVSSRLRAPLVERRRRTLVFEGYSQPLADLDRYLQAAFEVLNSGPHGRPPLFYMAHLAWRHRRTQTVLFAPRWVQAVLVPAVVLIGTHARPLPRIGLAWMSGPVRRCPSCRGLKIPGRRSEPISH